MRGPTEPGGGIERGRFRGRPRFLVRAQASAQTASLTTTFPPPTDWPNPPLPCKQPPSEAESGMVHPKNPELGREVPLTQAPG